MEEVELAKVEEHRPVRYGLPWEVLFAEVEVSREAQRRMSSGSGMSNGHWPLTRVRSAPSVEECTRACRRICR